MITEVGSKTFFIGEYAALRGGPAILLSTAPRFQLQTNEDLKKTGWVRLADLAPQSPVGRWLKEHKAPTTSSGPDHISNALFFDPHAGRGGFGASSAQFALAYAAMHPAALDAKGKCTHAWLFQMWQTYRALVEVEGVTPSGLDVLAQALGGVSFLDVKSQHGATFDWPFERMDFLLIRTGIKVATHEHLSELGPWNSDQQLEMEDLVRVCLRGFEIKSEKEVIGSINQYASLLERLNFVHLNARDLMSGLRKHKGVWAVKGCGALGADVVLALVDKSMLGEIKELITVELKREVIASASDLSPGLEIKNEN